MATKKKLLQAAAGTAAAGGAALNVEDVFSTYLYTGNGQFTGDTQTITNGIDLAGEGGLVWSKARTQAYGSGLFDTERGATKYLVSDNTTSEITSATTLTSFNNDGFTLGLDSSWVINKTGVDYASWTFRKAPKFFDVVTYTGNATARTISHNLGSTPGTIIIKRTDGSEDWQVWHRSLDSNNNTRIFLNTTAAAASVGSPHWNSTAPTDSVFSLGTSNQVNRSGSTFVAYLFAHNDGDGEFGPDGDQDIIKCGSYDGNGTTNGPNIDLGFEPQWVIIKNIDAAGNWNMFDNMRGLSDGGNDMVIYSDLSNAEDNGNDYLKWTSQGFQLISTSPVLNDNN